MKKVNEEYIKSCRELFNITGSPVFGAMLFYMERTGETITLDGANLEKAQGANLEQEQQEELSL